MRKVEQVKIISAGKAAVLAEAYNKWYCEMVDAREKVSVTKGCPFVIKDRQFTVSGSGTKQQLHLIIFYEHMVLTENMVEGDKGKHLDKTGVSAVGRRNG